MRPGHGGQGRPPGDQDRRFRGVGQQRTQLGGPGGVVQHDQQLPAPGPLAVEADQLVLVLGGRYVVHGAQRAQQPAQHPGGVPGSAVRGAQVGVQLPVGEVPLAAVGRVDGEGGLAEPGHSGDQHPAGPPGALPVGSQRTAQQLQFGLTAGEVDGVGRQHGRSAGRAAGSVPPRAGQYGG